MPSLPSQVATFLQGKRFAVAGVSRDGKLPANFIFRKLRLSGYEAVPVNPNADTVEGVACYRDLTSVPGAVDGVIVATHPDAGAAVVREACARGIRQIWFHRSFGAGSVSDAALKECRDRGVEPIVGGCPMMYCGKVDIPHRCMRWWLGLKKRVPV